MSEHFQAGTEILTGSRWLPVIPDTIPRELTDTIAWYPAIIAPKLDKIGKWDKRPGDPKTGTNATWSDPKTRVTFGEAFMAYESHPEWFSGLGYMMHAESGLIGIDLDKCVSPDSSIAPWALEIVSRFEGAYWERSISGTGLRGFCRGTLPVGGCRSKVEGCSVELYADVRFLVVTGQAIQHTEALPELQPAVDVLHAQLTAGRSRATGTAITSGLTGPNTTPSPEVFGIIEAVMSGRWGSQMMEIWSRDALHVSGASEEDWALETEAVYQGIRLGHSGDTLARLVEEAMRAGPYRAKWDERRGVVSWLTQDIANAIATVQKRLEKYQAGPILVFDDESVSEPPAANETAEQTIARLSRELTRERSIRAQQQSVIQAQLAGVATAQAGKLAADELVKAIYETLAIPDEQLAARPKLVSLALAREAASRNSRGIFTMSNLALGRLTGLPEKVVSQIMQDLPARDGTPFERIVTRSYIEVAPGITEPRSIAQVRITTPDQTTVSVIRALHSISGPSDRETQRLAKARAKTAANAEAKIVAEVGKRIGWGWCSRHDNTDVLVRGFCSDCGEVVGERSIPVEEFRILNPEFQDSAVQPPLPVDVVTLPPEIRDSDPFVSWPTPVSIGQVRGDGARSKPAAVWRCTPCGSLEGNGDRCDGCGARELAAVSGGAAPAPPTVAFVPSPEWQVVPDGFPCPPGGEFNMNVQTGVNQGRWPDRAEVAG